MRLQLYPNFKHLQSYDDIFVYSDPHFGESDMIRRRGISDEEQVKRINSKLGKKTVIIFLGDIGDVSYISKIKGYKILVMGNHDAGETNYIRESHNETLPVDEALGVYKMVNVDNHLFDEVYEGIVPLNEKIMLSHEPVNIPFMMNIHGHVHELSAKNDKNHLNVCAEHIDYTPVSLNQLVKSGFFSKIESIHRNTIDTATKRKQKRLQK